MADKKLEFEIVAKGAAKAAKEVEKVADAAEDLEKSKPEIEVTADASKAAKDIEKVAEAAEDLEKLDPKIEVAADASAGQKVLADFKAEAKEITDLHPKVEVRVDTDSLNRAKAGLNDVADAEKRVSNNAPSSAGALRDVSGGLGNMGGAALDAGEGLMGLGETLGQLSPRLQGLGAALGKAGFLGAVLAFATEAAGSLFNAFTGAEKRVEKSAQRTVAAVAGTTKEVTKNFQALARANDDTWHGVATIWESFGETVKVVGDETDVTIENYERSLDKLKETPGVLAKVIRALREQTNQLDHTTDSYKENTEILDRYESELRTAMEAEAIAADAEKEHAAQQQILNQAVEMGIAITGRSMDAIRGDVQARIDAKTAAENQAAALEVTTAAYEAQIEKMKALAELQATAFTNLPDAIDAVAAAQRGVNTAVDEYNKKPTVENLQNVEDAAQDLADEYANYVKIQGELSGVEETHTSRLDATNASFLAQVKTLQGPAKQAILDRIGQLNGIPPEKLTEIAALIDQDKMAEAQAELDEASKAREVALLADADTKKAAGSVRAFLQDLEDAPPTKVPVGANTKPADGPLSTLEGDIETTRTMPVSANTSSASSSVRALEGDIEHTRTMPVRITVNTSSLRAALGSLEDAPRTNTTIINVPPTLNPNRVLAAVANGQRRNGSLRRG